VGQIASLDPSHEWPGVARALWKLRWKVGEVLGWDRPDSGVGSRVPTLRERLPADLRDVLPGPDFDPFASLYLLGDEFAAEMANRTVHSVMHLGWVPDGTGGYRGQMAVLTKPNGRRGAAYMAVVKPFRHLIVYPTMLRHMKREWRASASDPTPAHARGADRRDRQPGRRPTASARPFEAEGGGRAYVCRSSTPRQPTWKTEEPRKEQPCNERQSTPGRGA